MRGYSALASWSWNTLVWRPGTYQLAVLARNVGSTKSYEAYRTLNYVLVTPASAVTLTPSLASPAGIGGTVVFIAAAEWRERQLRVPVLPASAGRGAGAGAGLFHIGQLELEYGRSGAGHVPDGGAGPQRRFDEELRGLPDAQLCVGDTRVSGDVDPEPGEPGTIGDTINFTAATSGGSGKYEYQYYLRAPGGAQVLVRGYSALASWSWSTSGLAPGTYQVAVLARNVGSTKSYEAYRTLNYVLVTPASAVTLTPSVASPGNRQHHQLHRRGQWRERQVRYQSTSARRAEPRCSCGYPHWRVGVGIRQAWRPARTRWRSCQETSGRLRAMKLTGC